MKLSQALVELYRALIKDGVLILDLTAAPDNYNAPVFGQTKGNLGFRIHLNIKKAALFELFNNF